MSRSAHPLGRGVGPRPAPRFSFPGILLLSLAATAACTVEERPLADEETTAPTPTLQGVETMLHESAASWNAGDLAGFLDDYADTDELAFVGAAGVTRGLAEVRAAYESGYWSTGEPLDSLRFEDLEVRALGERHALALGRWELYRPAGAGAEGGSEASADTVTSTGWFTLVLELDEGRWRILHDHSSELAAAPGTSDPDSPAPDTSGPGSSGPGAG